MPRIKGQRLLKYVDQAVCSTATVVFDTVQFFNKYRPGPTFTPKWSDKPLLKSWQKTKPQLGWPRQTDSLCPECVKEARAKIMNGDENWQSLLTEKTGEVKANIIERDGEVWMVKDCPIHGHFEDMMAVDAKFLNWIEQNFPGRDIRAHNDEGLHNHGSSSIKHGRGSVLTVDLTNRCNMMCDPCFMDANQVGLRARTDLGRRQGNSRQRHQDQAPPPDVGAILGRRADHVALFHGRHSLRAQAGLQQRAGGHQRHRIRPESRITAAALSKRACVTPTCSLTVSATTPTAIARWATCST